MDIRDKTFKRTIIVLFILVFLTTIFFFDNDSRFIRDLIEYFKGYGYYKDLETLLSGFNFIYHVDMLVTWTFAPYQFMMIPIIAIAGVFMFSRLHGIFMYESIKYEQRNVFFIKKALLYSLGISFSFFMTYFIFLIIAFIFLRIDYESGIIYRSLFVDILGKNLYFSHREIFYFLEGFTRFLFIPFVYSIFSCAIAFFVNKKHMAYFVPLLIWFGFMAVGYLFYYLFPNIGQYFSPTMILASSSYQVNTFFALLPHLIVLSASIYFIIKAAKSYEF